MGVPSAQAYGRNGALPYIHRSPWTVFPASCELPATQLHGVHTPPIFPPPPHCRGGLHTNSLSRGLRRNHRGRRASEAENKETTALEPCGRRWFLMLRLPYFAPPVLSRPRARLVFRPPLAWPWFRFLGHRWFWLCWWFRVRVFRRVRRRVVRAARSWAWVWLLVGLVGVVALVWLLGACALVWLVVGCVLSR